MKNIKPLNDIVKPSLVLVLVAAVVAGAVMSVYRLTYEEPADGMPEEAGIAAAELLGTTPENFTEIPGEYSDGIIAAVRTENKSVAVNLTVSGYSGEDSIDMVVAASPDGKIIGLRILKSRETPNIGTKAFEPEFLDQFSGKSKTVERSDVDIVSGATITCDAVLEGINIALSAADKI
ncbi:MAG: FMN-binding protein [Oscillospiraceae bacterium]|nr:FMN-binding protein [Oscillospiraceae bacterium]